MRPREKTRSKPKPVCDTTRTPYGVLHLESNDVPEFSPVRMQVGTVHSEDSEARITTPTELMNLDESIPTREQPPNPIAMVPTTGFECQPPTAEPTQLGVTEFTMETFHDNDFLTSATAKPYASDSVDSVVPGVAMVHDAVAAEITSPTGRLKDKEPITKSQPLASTPMSKLPLSKKGRADVATKRVPTRMSLRQREQATKIPQCIV
jgi:hypothetical protein